MVWQCQEWGIFPSTIATTQCHRSLRSQWGFFFVFNQGKKYSVLMCVFYHLDLRLPFSFALSSCACFRCLLIRDKWPPLWTNFLHSCLHFFPLQSKDKICETSVDTTQMPSHTTIAIQQTTMRFRVLTTTKGVMTSQLPTSLPTEGNCVIYHAKPAEVKPATWDWDNWAK